MFELEAELVALLVDVMFEVIERVLLHDLLEVMDAVSLAVLDLVAFGERVTVMVADEVMVMVGVLDGVSDDDGVTDGVGGMERVMELDGVNEGVGVCMIQALLKGTKAVLR